MRTTDKLKQAITRWDSRLEITPVTDVRLLPRPGAELGTDQHGEAAIVWSEGEEAVTTTASGSLLAFAKLADANDQAVLRYVQRWGPLGLMQVLRITREDKVEWWVDSLKVLKGVYAPIPTMQQIAYVEPIGAYRALARKVRSILNAAAALYGGQRAAAEDVNWIVGCSPPPSLPNWGPADWPPERVRDLHRRLIAEEMTDWLRDSLTYPLLRWTEGSTPSLSIGANHASSVWDALRDEEQPTSADEPKWQGELRLAKALVQEETAGKRQMRWLETKAEFVNPFVDEVTGTPAPPRVSQFSPSRLYVALGVQLAAAITSEVGVHNCSICGVGYVPDRKPRIDAKNFCSDKCRETANRIKNREHKRKQRAAGRR